MEKSEILKARVSERTFANFNAICEALGEPPARQMRRLIEDFIGVRLASLDKPALVHYYRPDGYDPEVVRVRISLRDPHAMQYQGFGMTFRLPVLEARLIVPDQGYGVGASDGRGGDLRTDGIFVQGVWEAHIRSNGCSEASNPTPIADVVSALEAVVCERLSALRG